MGLHDIPWEVLGAGDSSLSTELESSIASVVNAVINEIVDGAVEASTEVLLDLSSDTEALEGRQLDSDSTRKGLTGGYLTVPQAPKGNLETEQPE
eukprot:scaffold37707_cov50-Prasinocladus_malaysianus.AAC.1